MGRADHICLCDFESLYVAQPGRELEAPHHVYAHAAAEWTRVGARHVADVEHGCTEESDDLCSFSIIS
jgi:hypothetical protein